MANVDNHPTEPDDVNRHGHDDAAQPKAPNREGDTRAGLAGEAHGDLAEDAAAHLERSGYTFQGISSDSQEIERQAACLIDWARAAGLILPASHTALLLKHSSTTAEHQVYYRQTDNRPSS